jgi:hypothetical protein
LPGRASHISDLRLWLRYRHRRSCRPAASLLPVLDGSTLVRDVPPRHRTAPRGTCGRDQRARQRMAAGHSQCRRGLQFRRIGFAYQGQE